MKQRINYQYETTQLKQALKDLDSGKIAAIDKVLSIPEIMSVKVNTPRVFEIDALDVKNGIAFNHRVQKSLGMFNVYVDGNLLYKKLSYGRLMWEFDALWVAVRDAGHKPLAFGIPSDLQVEIFSTIKRGAGGVLHISHIGPEVA